LSFDRDLLEVVLIYEDAEDEVAISIKDMTSTLLTSDRRLMRRATTGTSLVTLLVPEIPVLKD
jgi:hypothetical protein